MSVGLHIHRVGSSRWMGECIICEVYWSPQCTFRAEINLQRRLLENTVMADNGARKRISAL
jgi:hypothetical protein